MSRCAVIGNESLAMACAQLLQRRGHDVVAFVADEGAPARRAKTAGLPVVTSLAQLERTAPPDLDYLFSITNLRTLPAAVLALPRRASVNYHDGPLPRYGGVNAPVFALLNGERSHGITWHLMTEGIDEGGIVAQRLFSLAPDETALTLNTRCYEEALAAFESLIVTLDSGLPAGRVEPLDRATYCPLGLRPRAGGVIDWSRPATEIARLVWALDHGSYPNLVASPSTRLNGRVLLIGSMEVLPTPSRHAPGTVVGSGDDGVVVASGTNDVRLTHVLRTDGTLLSVAELLSDQGLQAGSRFEVTGEVLTERLNDAFGRIGRHEKYWMRRLAAADQPELPGVERSAPAGNSGRLVMSGLGTDDSATIEAATLAWLGRVGGKQTFDCGFCHGALSDLRSGVESWLAPAVPLRVETAGMSFDEFRARVAAEKAAVSLRGTWSVDAPARTRSRPAGAPVTFDVVARSDQHAPAHGAMLTCCTLPDGTVTWWHDDTRLPRGELDRMEGQFRVLLAGALSAPGTTIDELPVMSEAERHTLLYEWNATAMAVREQACLHDLFSEQAARTPDATALIDAGHSLSYRNLDQASNQLAHHLRARDVGADTIVGLYLGRSIETVIAILGIQKAGGAYLPLDPNYPADRLALMIEDAGVGLIVSDEALRGRLPSAPSSVSVDGDRAQIAAEPAGPPAPAAKPDNLAYVIYTSGSTGRPKGVTVEHRNVVNFCHAMDACLGTTPGVWLAVTSLSFDISVLELAWTLARGFTVVIHDGDSGPEQVPLLIARHGVTHLQCTPSLAMMLMLVNGSHEALARLEHLLLGGEALPTVLASELLRIMRGTIHNMYGPTETTIWSTTHALTNEPGPPPIGRPIGNTQLYLLDGQRRPLPRGMAGELYIGGRGVVRGYHGRPELTAERFVADPFGAVGGRLYRTGDLARYRDDGVVEFLGRADHQVKIRGHRIELGEIEHHLSSMHGVREAVVVARPDPSGHASLVAYVVAEDGAVAEPLHLRDALRPLVPEYMVPSRVIVLDAMPLTPNLKVDRKALPAPTDAPASRGGEDDGPKTAIEQQIAHIWQSVLGLERVGRGESFFDLGGHSLLAIQVHARLRAAFPSITLSIADLFRLPTLAQLALLLGDKPAAGRVARPAGASRRPEPIHFGPPADQLFGMLHRAQSEVAIGKVLLCYPLPPKYMLCYGAFQRLAVSLSEAGFDVLRFDYFGVGDSAGEPQQATAARWTADVEAALEYLGSRSRAARTALVGMRIGAVLAGRVSATRNDIDELVLWEPVIDGKTYAAELAAFAASPTNAGELSGTLDVFGFQVNRQLREGLAAMSMLREPPRAHRILLVETQERDESARLANSVPGVLRETLPGLDHDWQRLIEGDTVVNPVPHLRRIRQFLTEALPG
jgi:amino acid adenylation domain-containing protein